MNSYDRGDQVRLSLTTQVGGADADPTVLTLKIKKPDQTTTSHVYGVDILVIKDATGKYRYDVTLDQSGEWAYRWEATGAVVGAEENAFYVQTGSF